MAMNPTKFQTTDAAVEAAAALNKPLAHCVAQFYAVRTENGDIEVRHLYEIEPWLWKDERRELYPTPKQAKSRVLRMPYPGRMVWGRGYVALT